MKNLNADIPGRPVTVNKTRSVIILAFMLSITGVLYTAFAVQKNNPFQQKPTIIMNIPGYPLVFELNKGDSILIDRTYKNRRITRTIQLKNIRLFTEHNSWFPDSLGRSNYYKAEVDITVAGKLYTLNLQPYQMPTAVDGLRIYIEAVKEMDKIPNLDPTVKMDKEIRFSVCLEGEPWGIPSELEFPVNDYRWRSASYNNTWSALVPFNALYYHKGEDFGAIPDKLDVCAWADGEVIKSPPAEGNIGSNSILIRNRNGIVFDYHHCNTEYIDPGIVTGRSVKKGQHIAKTGMTWNGKKSQHADPHLHTGMSYNGYQISLFPYMIEAYFRKYDDKLLAVAGGYRFAKSGETIEVDGLRSICREDEKIASYQWRLHDGQIINQPVAKVKYNGPGFYSEELIVTTANGVVDKDFLQVRVYDQNPTRKIAYGWAYYYPLRNLKPGQDILFWNRIYNTETDVRINFGDGTAVQTIRDEILHSYTKSGNYTVELTSRGINNEAVSVKLEVIID